MKDQETLSLFDRFLGFFGLVRKSVAADQLDAELEENRRASRMKLRDAQHKTNQMKLHYMSAENSLMKATTEIQASPAFFNRQLHALHERAEALLATV